MWRLHTASVTTNHRQQASEFSARRVGPVIVAMVGAAATLSLIAIGTSPLRADIGGPVGLLFWIAVVAVSAAAPVRMPGGTLVNVTSAPVIAVAVLGGPGAAAIVALVGTTEWREIRGFLTRGRHGPPWYGTLYNHSAVAVPAILAAFLYQAIAGAHFGPGAEVMAVALVAGFVHVGLNSAATAMAIGIREGRSGWSILLADARQVGTGLLGLAPLGWLLAVVYVMVGAVGLLPVAAALYSTRRAYQKVVEIRDMFTQTVKSLASAVDAKDPFTAGHSVRVQVIAKDVGREMGCSEDELEALEWGGLLHDIGKIGIPDAILLKQGALTRHERIVMNGHPVKGEEIIRPVAKLAPELPIIRHHHEWYNGSGYPDHLVGEEIPKLARIMHVADAFEAMTAARPYRMTPLTEEQALGELHKYTGIQFDPKVVAAFVRVLDRRPSWATPTAPPPLPGRRIPQLGETEAQAA